MSNTVKKNWKVLVIALVFMIGGSLLGAWIHTSAGNAKVEDVLIRGTKGNVVSAYLYTPKTVNRKNPAPGILAMHGGNNQKEFMDNTALELARRGYVVVSIDLAGHGYSQGAGVDTVATSMDGLLYLRSLPVVQKEKVGIIGMSLGGTTATGLGQLTKDYNAMFFMDSSCYVLPQCSALKNLGVSLGRSEEFPQRYAQTPTGREIPNSKLFRDLFGTKEAIKVGQLYGSIADGTAHKLYQTNGTHASSTDDPRSIRNAIDWFELTLKGKTDTESDLVFPWKLFGTGIALFGALLFVFPMGTLLLQTSYFKPLAEAVPQYKGFNGAGWWIGALITTALGPILYLWIWQGTFFGGKFIQPNRLWSQSINNIFMTWGIMVGIITIILILLDHYAFTKRKGANAVNYGLTWEGNKIDWPKIGKSLLLAICILVPLYLICVFFNTVWQIDFRFWLLALRPMSFPRFLTFLGYLIPYAVFFIPLAIAFHGFLRPQQGKASVGREMLINSLVLTIGALVWVLVFYIPLFSGYAPPGAASAAGLAAIYYVPLLVLWPFVACIMTYFFHKTGHMYVGAFVATLFIVWYNAAYSQYVIGP
ncbi:MAG TPA: alpha/beta hydrolase [Syntrophorhabdaceae bacterium]|nr:alpha/beta hydrolase [Syntrophorhabdaceae bacterium]